jgi:transposase-like protein
VEAWPIRRGCARDSRQFTAEFREAAVRIVRETGRPIAQVARELGINARAEVDQSAAGG